ncbi:hypothetical protein IEO21_08447 [Rhodonia placenta]|uniref:Uncharacterized protein n=1 Tax=Rhodonia placenta TaxID=104341 RepID=A0A8H7TYQ2_9APHY|nr:hypothetical protein IEO21_08447 [Postia placenta]
MDTIPPEIHALIFAFACSDDGTTGRSLSCVSRYMRAVSAPFRWQSLAVSGVNQARGFAAVLGAATRDVNTTLRRPVHHLFLSTRRQADAIDDHAVYGWQTSTLEDWPDYQAAILAYAAPTLETLTFLAFDPFFSSAMCIQDLLKVPFPRLTELTIRGRCTPSQLSLTAYMDEPDSFTDVESSAEQQQPADGCAARGAPTRPKLRRLHLACAYHGFAYGTRATSKLIHTLAPQLTHLRLSMLDMWGSKRVAEILHAECADLGIAPRVLPLEPLPAPGPRFGAGAGVGVGGAAAAACTAQDVRWARVLPARVQRFVIQPPPTAPSDFYCSCCMDVRGDADVMRVFEAMGRGADARFLYQPARQRGGYGYGEAKADWLARIAERGGCWEEAVGADAGAGAWEAHEGGRAHEERALGAEIGASGRGGNTPCVGEGKRRRLWKKMRGWRVWPASSGTAARKAKVAHWRTAAFGRLSQLYDALMTRARRGDPDAVVTVPA